VGQAVCLTKEGPTFCVIAHRVDHGTVHIENKTQFVHVASVAMMDYLFFKIHTLLNYVMAE
jgi:hypothetical protein